MKKTLYTLLISLTALTSAAAHDSNQPDSHAPLGVMGDHLHKKGEWMTSYRYKRMNMGGNRSGNNNLSAAEVLRDFIVTPLAMSMEMHMFGLMYGLTDDITLSAMTSYNERSMTHITRTGRRFKTRTDGLGDTKVTGLFKLLETQGDNHRMLHKLHAGIGLSLPTGSIKERDATPAGASQKLPYPMQLGSGTYDPLLSLTYVQKHDDWSWGAQGNATFRTGKNSQGYRLGNSYGVTSWIAKNVTNYASLSFRLDGRVWNDIKGADQDLVPGMVPTARADLRGGESASAAVGVNFLMPKGVLKGQRLALEFGAPFYQNLDGPQLETDYQLTAGWQMAF